MSLRGLILLAGVGAAGYWAYTNGLFAASEDAPQETGKGAGASASFLPSSFEDGTDVPLELGLLKQNIDVVQPWARRNLAWVAAMMWQESRGNPSATSYKGAAGLMQVMPGTAADLVSWGYDEFSADPESLYSVRGSIYFGTAYLEYLAGKSANRDWITRAYNAGPGGKRSDGTWPAETEKYLAAIKARFFEITKSKEA